MVTNFAEVVTPLLMERTSKGLADAVSRAIGDHSLEEDATLPPIRAVAEMLVMSPSTVSTAWKLLARAGAIRSDGRRGTVVLTRRGPGPARYRRALNRSIAFKLDLSTGVPDAQLLPDLAPALGALHRAGPSVSYLDDPIIPGLVEALRADWPYDAGDFAIVDGAMDALDQVASHLLHFGDVVIVENPSFPPALDLFEGLGVRIIGIDIDEEGLMPAPFAETLAGRPRALLLQPRAHNPTGVSMSTRRSMELASLVRGTDVVVIEDDSAGAVASTVPISLGRWLPEQTVHIRSFSKSHGPDLRLAAMSGPPSLMAGVRNRRLLGQAWTSRLLQTVLLDLLQRAASREQIDRARATYSRRRRAICTALAERGVVIVGEDGLNLWLPVRDETAALLLLASRGIGAAAGSPFATRSGHEPHLRVTTGLIEDGIDELADVLVLAAGVGRSAGPR